MSYVLKEEVQLWVAAGVDRNLKQRHEDILQHFLEVAQLLLRVVDVTLKKQEKQFKKPTGEITKEWVKEIIDIKSLFYSCIQ